MPTGAPVNRSKHDNSILLHADNILREGSTARVNLARQCSYQRGSTTEVVKPRWLYHSSIKGIIIYQNRICGKSQLHAVLIVWTPLHKAPKHQGTSQFKRVTGFQDIGPPTALFSHQMSFPFQDFFNVSVRKQALVYWLCVFNGNFEICATCLME